LTREASTSIVLSLVQSRPRRQRPNLRLRRRLQLPRIRLLLPLHLLPTSIHLLMALAAQTGVPVTMTVCQVRKFSFQFSKMPIHPRCRMYGYLWSPTIHLDSPDSDPSCRRRRNRCHPHHHCRTHSRRPPLRALRCQCIYWRHHQICVGCKQSYSHQVLCSASVQQD